MKVDICGTGQVLGQVVPMDGMTPLQTVTDMRKDHTWTWVGWGRGGSPPLKVKPQIPLPKKDSMTPPFPGKRILMTPTFGVKLRLYK